MSKYPGRIVTDLAPAGYSVFFDGSGDYLSTPTGQTNLTLATSDFTVEGFFYPLTQVQTNPALFTSDPGTSLANTLMVQMNAANNALALWVNNVNLTASSTNNTITLNRWNHIAVCRTGGSTYSFYINGVAVNNLATNSTSLTTNSWLISLWYLAAHYFTGYISNFRIIKGTALYSGATINVPTQLLNVTNTQLLTCSSPAIIDQSSNAYAISSFGNVAPSTFTPFTAYVPYNPALGASTPGVWTVDEAMQAAGTRQWNMYDPNFQNTTLLLHGNPTNGPTWITDASANRFTVTPGGDVRAANLSPFSLTTFATSGSGYFDGTGDFVSLVYDTAFNFGTGDFTVEAWLFCTLFANSSIVDNRASAGASPWAVYINASGQPYLYDGTSYTSSIAITLNAWTHVAVARQSGTLRIFVNGVQGLSTSLTGSLDRSAGNTMKIGINTAGSADPFNGYISNVRIVKGVAVYTGAFTTPTAPLTAVQAAGTNISAITGTQTSLLTLQNSQSANNNAFLDSSSNNFLITRNGNTTQGTFSPFSQTGWSVYFSSDTITTPSNSAFDPSGQNVTVDFFIYLTRYPQANNVVFEVGVSTVGDLQCNILNTGEVRFATGGNTGSSISGFTLNTWHYITCVKSGNNLTVYLNLVAGPTVSLTANSRTTMYIGSQSGGNNIEGYISNFRYVRGSANVPTAIPTAPLTAITNTSLLTFQSNRFVDNSSNGFTLNILNDSSVQAFSPFYPTAAYTPQTIGGSGYFDGTGDFLTWPSGSSVAFGTGDFTVEAFVYLSSAPGQQYIIDARDASNTATWAFAFGLSGAANGKFGFFDGATLLEEASASVTANAFAHLVAVRSGTTLSIFVNRNRVATVTNSRNISSAPGTSYIGNRYTGAGYLLTGYLSGVRIVKGTAVYDPTQSTLTIPTAPLTAITNTSLLLNFTNAGVVDSTGKNALETAGNAQISTTQSRFGGSSIYFDGTGDSLATAPSQLFNLGASDFTIEFWLYPGNFSGVVYPLFSTSARSKTDVLAFEMNTGGGMVVYATASGGSVWGLINAATIGTLTISAWNHVALVRNGSSFRGYVNGVQSASLATSSSALASFDGFNIGTSGAGGGFLNGYMDDLRITRFARYTGAFTPQTSQWQDQ